MLPSVKIYKMGWEYLNLPFLEFNYFVENCLIFSSKVLRYRVRVNHKLGESDKIIGEPGVLMPGTG